MDEELILEINKNYSISDYLNNETIKKAVMIITDKQQAILFDIGKFKGLDHYELIDKLEKLITGKNDKNENYFYMLFIDKYIIIKCPSNDKVSINQKLCIEELLDEIDNLDELLLSKGKYNEIHDFTIINNEDINDIREYLSRKLCNDKEDQEEKIIGKELVNKDKTI